MIALTYVGISAFILMAGYRLVESLITKLRRGTFVNYEHSNFYTRGKSFKYYNVVPLLANGITNFANICGLTYAFKYASMGGIN